MQLSQHKAIALIEWVFSTKNYRLAKNGESMFDKSPAGKQAAIDYINSDQYKVNQPLNLCFKMNSDLWSWIEIYNHAGRFYGVDDNRGGRKTVTNATMHGLITKLRLDSAGYPDSQPVPVQYIQHDPLLDINDITQRVSQPSIKALTPNGFTFIDANSDYGLMLCNDHNGEPIVLSFYKRIGNGQIDYVLLGSTYYRPLVDYPYSQQHALAVKTIALSKPQFMQAYEYGYEITSTDDESHVLMRFTQDNADKLMSEITDIEAGLIDFIID